MKKSAYILFYIFSICLPEGTVAQSSDKGSGYSPPMDIPMNLSGNFGEMRSNHFHTGIDLRTQGRQGIPVKSIADGSVSRIKISPTGYGKALYIDHPDGRTSVYAHLSRFNDAWEDFIRDRQYEQEQWAIEYYPAPDELVVTQGEIIGYSGNSGSSTGPHLHFEIRDTANEHPLNPLNSGFYLKDDLLPVIQGLRVYPQGALSQVDGSFEPINFPTVSGKRGNYTLSKTINVTGTIGLGIHTFDHITASKGKHGIYSLEMRVNDSLWYSHKMDELDFDNFRQVNCHKDYDLYHKNRWRYHKCFLAENNTLEIYDALTDNGRISVTENESVHVEFIARDIAGNESRLKLNLLGAPPIPARKRTPKGLFLDASQDNIIEGESHVVRIPRGRLYDDLWINMDVIEGELSPIVQVHDRDVPLDDDISVRIKPFDSLVDDSNMIMGIMDFKGRYSYTKGAWKDGWYESDKRNFGMYFLTIDKAAPLLEGVTGLSQGGRITLHLSDDLSGIESFRVEVDGNWLRMSHNAARTKAWGDLRELELAPGQHKVKVQIRDLAGNESEELRLFKK